MKRLAVWLALFAAAATTFAGPVVRAAIRDSAQASPPARAPQRIVSLVPAATEMVFAMGAGSRLVGVGSYDRFPPEVEKIAKVGGLLDPNIEAILALRPDLAIVYDTQDELTQRLARGGVPIFRYSHRDLADITSTMRELGVRVGSKPAADAAAGAIEQQLQAVRARVAGLPRPKALLIFGRDPGTLRNITASAGYGFLHYLLELAGGTDVLGDLKRQSVDLSTEMVLARAPEVIVELHYGSSLRREGLAAERLVWNALASVPAVRNNRVYLLTGDEFVLPGPRIVLAADRFARALHLEAYQR